MSNHYTHESSSDIEKATGHLSHIETNNGRHYGLSAAHGGELNPGVHLNIAEKKKCTFLGAPPGTPELTRPQSPTRPRSASPASP